MELCLNINVDKLGHSNGPPVNANKSCFVPKAWGIFLFTWLCVIVGHMIMIEGDWGKKKKKKIQINKKNHIQPVQSVV